MKQGLLPVSAALAAMFALAGCMSGATWSETVDERGVFFTGIGAATDPHSVGIVAPNDTMIDPYGNPEANQNPEYLITARVVPAEDADALLRGFRGASYNENRKSLLDLGAGVADFFGSLRTFRIVGAEEAALSPTGTTSVQGATPQPNLLTYSILSLSSDRVRGEYHPAVRDARGRIIARAYRDPDGFNANAKIQVRLIAPDGSQRFSLEGEGAALLPGAGEQAARTRALEIALEAVKRKYAVEYAPRAFVLQMRGNGLFAQLSVGRDFGVTPGMQVAFIQMIKLGAIAGRDNIQETVVARGTVVAADHRTAWVKIENHHYRQVHIGTTARLEQ